MVIVALASSGWIWVVADPGALEVVAEAMGIPSREKRGREDGEKRKG